MKRSKKYWKILPVAGLAGLFAGCLSTDRQSAMPTPRPLGAELASVEAEAQTPAPTFVPDVLKLSDALTLALRNSPELAAFSHKMRVAEARELQAGLRPNPEFEAEFENFAGSGPLSGTDALETTVSLAQAFPLGGDIKQRREVARYQSRLAGWDYEAARLEVLTEVTRRYIGALAGQRRVEVAREAMKLARQVQAATKKRIDAGDAPPIDAARASVPVATATVALKRAERELTATRKQLALSWGASKPTFARLTGSLDELTSPPAADQLVALINENPAVARWATEISARQAEVRLAKAEAVPDLTGVAGIRHDGAEDVRSLLVGISLPLPIFDRRQGDIQAARQEEASARQRRREAELGLETMLSEAYVRLVNAHAEATALHDLALPPATEAFNVTQRAFEQGDLMFLDVLDAERTLVELRTQYLDALVAYHKAAAEIEGLIGQPLEQLDSNTDKRSENNKTKE